jgi:hypothetical protein
MRGTMEDAMRACRFLACHSLFLVQPWSRREGFSSFLSIGFGYPLSASILASSLSREELRKKRLRALLGQDAAPAPKQLIPTADEAASGTNTIDEKKNPPRDDKEGVIDLLWLSDTDSDDDNRQGNERKSKRTKKPTKERRQEKPKACILVFCRLQ